MCGDPDTSTANRGLEEGNLGIGRSHFATLERGKAYRPIICSQSIVQITPLRGKDPELYQSYSIMQGN